MRRATSVALGLAWIAALGATGQVNAQDRRLGAKWDYVSASFDDHLTGAEGSLDLRSNGRFFDSRRIQGPRTTFGADTEGSWAASGDELILRNDAGDVVGRWSFFIGSTDRNGHPYAALTLKGDGLLYLLVHRQE